MVEQARVSIDREDPAEQILRDLLRNLQEVRAQRSAGRPHDRVARASREGELWGLDVAISAVKRRIR